MHRFDGLPAGCKGFGHLLGRPVFAEVGGLGVGDIHQELVGFVQVALGEGDPHGQNLMAREPVSPLPAGGQVVALLVLDVG